MFIYLKTNNMEKKCYNNVILGKNVKIGSNCEIREKVVIGDNVILKDSVTIGTSVTIQDNLTIGFGTKIWDHSYVRSNLGNNCVVARGVYIDFQVPIGNNVKIQNRNNITHGVTLEDGVFVGPNVTFSNDKYPRSVNRDMSPKTSNDWVCVKTLIKKGASLGAGCVIVCGTEIGEWAMIGAGTVVSRNVPNYAMVVGNPARIVKWVSKSGFPMSFLKFDNDYAVLYSKEEDAEYQIPIDSYKLSLKNINV